MASELEKQAAAIVAQWRVVRVLQVAAIGTGIVLLFRDGPAAAFIAGVVAWLLGKARPEIPPDLIKANESALQARDAQTAAASRARERLQGSRTPRKQRGAK